jgi:tetratricopeptide (TPR) repeat protein
MPSYDFRVKRDVTLASGCRRSHFARSLESRWQTPPAIGHTWPGKHLVLHSAVAVGLWLVPTAGLAESLWLQSTAALAESRRLESAAALADKSDCLNSKDHDLRILGCAAMIQRNPKDVVAYHNRGDAYGLKGDIDRAISDYTKAIELNPNYAPAYNSRGRAYTRKGDYDRAVDDVTKAGELTRKARPQAPGKQKGAANQEPLEAWWAWIKSKLTN